MGASSGSSAGWGRGSRTSLSELGAVVVVPVAAVLLYANRRLNTSGKTGGDGRVVGIVGRMGSGKSYLAVRARRRRRGAGRRRAPVRQPAAEHERQDRRGWARRRDRRPDGVGEVVPRCPSSAPSSWCRSPPCSCTPTGG